MKYQLLDMNTDEVLHEEHSQFEINEYIEYNQLELGTYYTIQIIPCRGCGCDEAMERHDAHGITTGYWCDPCYEDGSKYTYRKDKYPTIETHGYGERLENDY